MTTYEELCAQHSSSSFFHLLFFSRYCAPYFSQSKVPFTKGMHAYTQRKRREFVCADMQKVRAIACALMCVSRSSSFYQENKNFNKEKKIKPRVLNKTHKNEVKLMVLARSFLVLFILFPFFFVFRVCMQQCCM